MMSETRKAYVLVHGAYHGGWCWRRVADLLIAQGHRVWTPTQTGVGERAHLISRDIDWNTFITDITNVLDLEEIEDAILVGHSFAGGTITGAADRRPERLRRLVYLDAMVLQHGQSTLDISSPELMEQFRRKAEATSGGLSVPQGSPEAFGVLEPDQVAWMKSKLTPQPWSIYLDQLLLHNPVGNGVPVTYIACSAPYFPSTETSREYAKRQQDWDYLEINEPHDCMVTAPAKLASMLAAIE